MEGKNNPLFYIPEYG